MPEERTFRVLIVAQNHGIGIEETLKLDKVVVYKGKL